MQKEGMDIIIDNKDIEEVLPKINRRDIAFQSMGEFLLLLLLLYALKWAWEEEGRNIVADLVALLLILILPLFLVLPALLIDNCLNLIETVVISSKGIKYSSLFKKIDCDWKDISILEVVTHKQRSDETGFISSTVEYIIHTSKGTFSISEGGGWDYPSISKVYDMIASRSPDVEIVPKEYESIVSQNVGM